MLQSTLTEKLDQDPVTMWNMYSIINWTQLHNNKVGISVWNVECNR